MAMAQTQTEPEAAPSHSSRLPLILGLVLMIAGGGASFAALYLGLLPASHGTAHDTATGPAALPDIAYVALEPMVISLSDPAARHLRFSAQIEVPAAYQKDVELLRPRVVDVLNGYLRAVELRDIEDPAALIRLRAQMLRRVQIVCGADRVRDLLIMEFVLN
ncbi:flagellar FliL protein [Rhodobacter sp. 140A]|nr:flagellar FliL protein [Rhodobacter sp. 140A]